MWFLFLFYIDFDRKLMSNIDRTYQTDSPSLSIGEFYTGTGRARQAAGKEKTTQNESVLLNIHQSFEWSCHCILSYYCIDVQISKAKIRYQSIEYIYIYVRAYVACRHHFYCKEIRGEKERCENNCRFSCIIHHWSWYTMPNNSNFKPIQIGRSEREREMT